MQTSYKNRADLAIAQGALTNSKRPSAFIRDVYPTHASWGKGAILYADKKAYVDYYGGLGSNLLGYGNPIIKDAIADRYAKGATLSLSSELEVEYAEKLKAIFRFVELWKFGKNGSDVCAAALRISRTYTGRDLVLSDNYHGWHDDFISLCPPHLGIPKRDWIKPIDFSLIKDAACVILEPVVTDYSKERKEYLEKLRAECTRYGTVLIFDEIITGLRFPKYCVSNYFGIEPDIILIGKALGGGLPLSAMGGKKDLMNCGEYFYSGTFFGETCSIAASMAVLSLMTKDGTKFNINDLWNEGEMFLNRFNALHDNLKIEGYPTRGAFKGNDLVKAYFWQEAIKAGVLFGPSWFFNFCLPEYTDQVINVCRDIFNKIKTGSVLFHGQMPAAPFAQKLRS